LPALQETSSLGQNALIAMAQVTVADVVTILSVPIVIQPSKAADAALGSALVAAGVLLILASARLVAGRGWVHTVRHLSKERHWALDLRMALVVLFFLAWLAQESGTSVLIAGFGAGVMVAAIGGPKRLSNQVRGIADGFFVPLYFVVLGAQLDLGGLFEPSTLSLAASLFALNVLIHVTVAAVARRPIATGLAASAQLGVPAAIASLGLSEGVLSAADATAIVVAALASLGACAVGVQMLVQREDQATPRPGAAAAQGMAPTST
jgi:Kef-type K+ transport system membrane component KefB